ncbi:hypothetical protein XELAEV_18034654mg [Xenopus laevis]|uniref:Protein kinase domain-containing protein n=1 Tax=Xenopus laevis TaxID=8355 RepID=A0A974HBE5_XENLA|nr:hypothetical protein XELAEV_18034654mg [Xenopus laevis]
MAPEILNRKPYNAAVDWWSFGITICKMATGKSPFNNSGVITELISSVKVHEPKIPDELDEDLKHLLGQLLEKDQKQRLGVRGNIRCHPFYKTIDWVPYGEKLSFLEYQEDEGTSGDSNTVPGFSFKSSTWLT